MDFLQSPVYERLIGAGLRFISYRPRSKKEILEFLSKKLTDSHTYAPLIVARVIERLTELGYINDYSFGAWWVSQRTGRKPKGKRLIEMELKQKGVSEEIIDAVLSGSQYDLHVSSQREGGDSKDNISGERERAQRAVEKKRVAWKDLPTVAQKKKLSEFLYRRGFDWDTIRSVVDDMLAKE